MVEIDGLNLVIDTGPDFRQQMLREKVKKLDAVIFTHQHKDHTAGLDDIRSFYFRQRKNIPIYARQPVVEQLKMEFAYMFAEFKYPGVASVDIHPIDREPFFIENTRIIPIEVMHHRLPVLGFRIGNFTYITDANYIADEELEKIMGTEILVLNALQKTPHISHFTLMEAIEVVKKINPKQAYFTHISYHLGFHQEVSKELPEGMFLAYDGLQLTLP
jgi:phosphoribosyl 1,2-cyclic phosphate phosphodiesterase